MRRWSRLRAVAVRRYKYLDVCYCTDALWPAFRILDYPHVSLARGVNLPHWPMFVFKRRLKWLHRPRTLHGDAGAMMAPEFDRDARFARRHPRHARRRPRHAPHALADPAARIRVEGSEAKRIGGVALGMGPRSAAAPIRRSPTSPTTPLSPTRRASARAFLVVS